LKKLKTLNVYRNLIKSEGARFIAKENCLSQLEELDLAQNEIGDEGVMALAVSKLFPNLVALYMDNNFASVEAKEDARACPNFHKLESLNL
jgi:Ran GTPase-activating protein (RanGAP) involved in mRNA processing and transport